MNASTRCPHSVWDFANWTRLFLSEHMGKVQFKREKKWREESCGVYGKALFFSGEKLPFWWKCKKFSHEFSPRPLNFDTCVMKAVKLQRACLHGSLSDDILYERGWFITLLICFADLMRELYLTATVDKLLSHEAWNSLHLKRKINSVHHKT